MVPVIHPNPTRIGSRPQVFYAYDHPSDAEIVEILRTFPMGETSILKWRTSPTSIHKRFLQVK